MEVVSYVKDLNFFKLFLNLIKTYLLNVSRRIVPSSSDLHDECFDGDIDPDRVILPDDSGVVAVAIVSLSSRSLNESPDVSFFCDDPDRKLSNTARDVGNIDLFRAVCLVLAIVTMPLHFWGWANVMCKEEDIIKE